MTSLANSELDAKRAKIGLRWGQAEDRRRSHAAGFDHHLTKPIDLAVLELLKRN